MLHSTIAAWFFTLICMVLSQHKKSIFDLVLSTVSHATKFFFDQMCMITWYSVFTFELFLKHLWLWFNGDPNLIHNWISGDHIWSKKELCRVRHGAQIWIKYSFSCCVWSIGCGVFQPAHPFMQSSVACICLISIWKFSKWNLSKWLLIQVFRMWLAIILL